jgi:dipeptidyl aminopeptidase/acylaminoacyl peptidase
VAVTSGLATTVLDTRTHEQVNAPIVLPATGYRGADGAALPAGVAWSAAWTPGGSRLLIGTDDRPDPRGGGEVVAVDTATWQVVDRKDLPVVPEVMAVSPDGRSLAVSGGEGSSVVFLDPATLEVRHRVALRGDDRVWALSFSPDGRFVAAGGLSGGLHLVDTRTWAAREPVLLHAAPLMQFEWLRDGHTVASSGQDGTVGLFDAERGVVRAEGLPASVHGEAGYVRLVPDPDRELVVLNDEHVGLRYPLDADAWLRQACAVAGRDLTRVEWERYLPDRPYRPTCTDLD